MLRNFAQILALAAVAKNFAAALPSPELVTVGAPFGDDSTTVLTAHVVGVDSDGRTTYALEQNAMQGSSVLASATGTLVEGSDHVSYTYALNGAGFAITLGVDCDLKDGNAICSDGTETATISSLGSWVLDVVSTSAPSGSSATPTAGASSSAPTSETTQALNSSLRNSSSDFAVFLLLLALFLTRWSVLLLKHWHSALAAKFAAASPAPALITVVAPYGDTVTTLSAEVLGVDAAGRTTYALPQNEMQGTTVLASATGTLVEGADYISYTYELSGDVAVTIGAECALTGGNAVCSDATETATLSGPLGSWVLDVAVTTGAGTGTGTATGTGPGTTPTTSTGTGTGTTPTTSASNKSGASTSGSSTSSPAPSKTSNSSQRAAVSGFTVLLSLVLGYQFA
ncbi:hypothetical protein FB451DRAFT_1534466 [Mycena latifolia]|nr:hypothetical protein FB451DRAFT_1534466 [Mycena latifolia]